MSIFKGKDKLMEHITKCAQKENENALFKASEEIISILLDDVLGFGYLKTEDLLEDIMVEKGE